MGNNNSIQNKHRLSSHEFEEDAPVFYKSLPERDSGWYFTDNSGVLFGPIRDESMARKMLAQLATWFNNRDATSDN